MTAPARSLHVVAERRSSPAGNSHAYHRTPPNMTDTDGVPPIEDILKFLRQSNAEFEIKKRLRTRKTDSIGPYHHPFRSPSPREPAPIVPDPVNLRRASTYHSHHLYSERSCHDLLRADDEDESMIHRKSVFDLNQLRNPQSVLTEAQLISSNAAMDPSLKRMEVGVERIGRLVQSAEKQVETILSQVRDLSGKFLESSSPQLHHHREHDPVDWREDVNEISGQKLQETAAHQVFEEKPQSIATFDDEDKGFKNQETEVSSDAAIDGAIEGVPVQEIQEFSVQATSKDFPESTSKFNHQILKINEVNIQANEFGIKILIDDDRLESNLSFKLLVQDETIVFPVSDSGESSYFVIDNGNLETNSVDGIALHFSQEIRMDGEAKKRIGVG